MAINLGDINFGLGPDTTRLRSSVRDIVAFDQAVRTAARSTAAGAQSVATALMRQEAAAVSALQRVQKLMDSMRSAGAPLAMINQVSSAFRSLTTEMTTGQRSALGYQRAMERFNQTMTNSTRALRQYKQEHPQASQQTGMLVGAIQKLSAVSVLVNGPLGGIATRLSVLSTLSSKASIAWAALLGGIAAGITLFVAASKNMIDAEIAFQRYTRALEAVQGPQEKIQQTLAYIEKIAYLSGQSIVTLATQYGQLAASAQGTNLEGEKTRKIFEAVVFASSKLALSSEDTEGALRAIQQMMSKGTVQAEELRGQLGDRLPGAFRIAAEAMGVTTQQLGEMMKKGQVVSEDFLPKFADALNKAFGNESQQKIEGIVQAQNRFANAWQTTWQSIDQSFGMSRAWEGTLDWLTNALADLAGYAKDFRDYIIELRDAFRGFKFEPLGNQSNKGDLAAIKGDMELTAKQKAMQSRFDTAFAGSDEKPITTQDLEAWLKKKNAADDKAEKHAIKMSKYNRDATQDIQRLQDAYLHVYDTPAQKDFYEMQAKITKQVEEYRDKLTDAGVPAAKIGQLTDQYATALTKLEKARYYVEHTTTAFQALSDVIGRGLDDAFSQLAENLSQGKAAFADFANVTQALLKDLLQTFLQLAVANPLKNALFGTNYNTLGGLGGGGGGIGGGLLSGVVNAIGGMFGGGGVVSGSLYHSGGTVGVNGGARRNVPASLFAGAPRFHSGSFGLGIDEVPLIAQKGERIVSKADANKGSSLMPIINIHNYTSERPRVTQTQQGGRNIIEILFGQFKEKIKNGEFDGSFMSRFNMRPAQRKSSV